MSKRPILWLVVLCLLCAINAYAGKNVRLATAAGPFYPEDAIKLRQAMQRYYNAASPPEPNAKLLACIVPHDGYGLSGEVAAHAFKHLKPGQYDKVVVLGPSHSTSFEGCSMAAVDAYITPLGLVPLAAEEVNTLSRLPLINARSVRYNTGANYVPLHEQEYSIEVVLPFLQEQLGYFELIPILVGDLVDAEGNFDMNRAGAVADNLRKIIDEKTLIVVSTNFTHYGNDFSFYPFSDNVQERIRELDDEAISYVLRRDARGFQEFLQRTSVPICGAAAIEILLQLLPRHAEGVLLATDTSGKRMKTNRRSISYAAIAFYDPTHAPLPADPNAPRLPTLEEMIRQRSEAPKPVVAPAPTTTVEAAPALPPVQQAPE